MAYSKITLNGQTLMDVTSDTVEANKLLTGETATAANGQKVTGTLVTSNDFVITLTQNQNGDWEPDCTYAEALAAYNAGKKVAFIRTDGEPCRGSYDDFDNAIFYGYFDYYSENSSYGEKSTSYIWNSTGITKDLVSIYYDTGWSNAIPSEVLQGKTFHNANGAQTGTATSRSSSDLTVSGATVTAPAGFYSAAATKSVASGTAGTPTATKGTVSNHSVSVTPSVTNTTGYITGGTKTGTAVTVAASELVSGTKSITENGNAIDVTNYANVNVNVESVNNQNKTVTPTKSQQSITADAGYTGLGTVTMDPIPANYVQVNSYDFNNITITPSENTQIFDIEDGQIYPSNGNTYGMVELTISNRIGTCSFSFSGLENNILYLMYLNITGNYNNQYFSNYRQVLVMFTNEITTINLNNFTSDGYPIYVNSAIVTKSGQLTVNFNVDITENISAGLEYHFNNNNYVGYSSAYVYAIPSTYVGSGVARKSSSDLTASGAKITAPAGYYANAATKSVASGTAGTPTAAKGTVSNHSINVTPSVTNTTGYITGGTKTGTAVTVTASELVSGTKSITENGTGIDVTNYANVDVNIPQKRTATITKTGMYNQSSGYYSYVMYNSQRYYIKDNTFEFIPGSTLYIVVSITSSDLGNGIVINIDNIDVVNTTESYYSYNYTLPNHDIDISLDDDTFQNRIEISASSITVNPLSVTTNGTYTAPTGTAYSPVTVNVEGGGSAVEKKQVTFYDYDGTIVDSYSRSDFMNLTALPSNPSHTGLVAQGWNWSLADAKTYLTSYPDCDLNIGQMYITASGNTEIDISLDSEHLSPYLTIAVSGSVTVDWGDNSATNTVTGTSTTTLKYTLHEYATAGDYTISISINSGSYAFYDAAGKAAVLSAYASDSSRRANREYSGTIKAIRLGTSTDIGASAFYNCYALQSITIPNSVTSIGSYSFSNCYSLQSITIPNSVTSIGVQAFQYCYALQFIAIPDSVTSIPGNAFSYCYSLQSITIPDSVTNIGATAFQYCYGLQSVTIPDGVTSIGTKVFQYCYGLQSVTIPDGVTSIGSQMFYNCYALQSITIPDNITSIGTSTFAGCYVLQSITIPDGVTSIGSSAFNSCYVLQSITIPDGVTSIATQTFYNCYVLQSITIPDGVTSIANNAFFGCYSLQSITIPESVTNIGTQAFSGCYAIEEYHLLPTTPPTLAGTNAFTGIVAGTIIYVPQGCLEAYQTATNWSTYASYMQEESA